MPFPLFKEKPPYEAMPQESFVFKEWLKKLQKYLDTIANVYNAEQGSGAGAAALSLGGNDGGDGFDQDLFVFGGSGSGTPGAKGDTGATGQGIPGLDGNDGEEGMMIPPSPSMVGDPLVHSYSPGSFSLATNQYVVMTNFLQLKNAEVMYAAGTAQLRIT